jgi:hypothetical protein
MSKPEVEFRKPKPEAIFAARRFCTALSAAL